MALVIRVPKTSPELDRRKAGTLAREIALKQGYAEDALRRMESRIERVEGTVPWEYVIEFPDVTT